MAIDNDGHYTVRHHADDSIHKSVRRALLCIEAAFDNPPGAVGQTPTAGGTAAGSGSFSLSFPTFGDQHYLSADQQRGHSWGSVGSSAALSAAAQSAVSSVV